MHQRSAALALAVALLMTACGGDEPTPATSPTPTQPDQGPTASASPPATESPTAVQTMTDAPDETVAPTTAEADVSEEFTVSQDSVEGPDQVQASVGDVVELVVTSNVADEIHVHGFDIRRDVVSGETAILEFQVDAPGVFEVEMEQRGLKITELVIR